MRTLAVVTVVLASLVPCRAQNLLPNADFDHDVSGWTVLANGSFPPNLLSWDATRSSSGPGGSALIHTPIGLGGLLSIASTCVPVTPGVTYSFGADYQFPSAAGPDFFLVSVGFASDAACANGIGGPDSSVQFPSLNPIGQWRTLAGPDVTAPPGAASALFAAAMASNLDSVPHEVNFDHAYFGPRGTVGPGQAVTEVPTLSEAGLLALALGLGVAALGVLRRRAYASSRSSSSRRFAARRSMVSRR